MSPQDLWKREIPSQKSKRGYEEQLQFTFGPRDATPEEFDEWQEKELAPWAEKQLPIVAIMAVIQLVMIGLMFSVMFLNSLVF
tara:strand:- start:472 stop:720 length:249 start_codon:yes stop_codon:yes gene_type:complete